MTSTSALIPVTVDDEARLSAAAESVEDDCFQPESQLAGSVTLALTVPAIFQDRTLETAILVSMAAVIFQDRTQETVTSVGRTQEIVTSVNRTQEIVTSVDHGKNP